MWVCLHQPEAGNLFPDFAAKNAAVFPRSTQVYPQIFYMTNSGEWKKNRDTVSKAGKILRFSNMSGTNGNSGIPYF